jgi:hypothetical protein
MTIYHGHSELLTKEFIDFISTEFGDKVELYMALDTYSPYLSKEFNDTKALSSSKVIEESYSISPSTILYTNKLGYDYLLYKMPYVDIILSDIRECDFFINSQRREIPVFDPYYTDFYEALRDEILGIQQ